MKTNGAILTVVIIAVAATQTRANVRRVTTSGSSISTCGDTWTNACGLDTALAESGPGDEVWVAAGTYIGTIDLVDAVSIVGGFAGTETMASQSDPTVHETVLDGNGTGPVVTSANHAASTILRGFRITNGYNIADLWDDTGGGGACLYNSSALIVQCVFDHNTSKSFGGAVYVRGSGSPEFINCKFEQNGGYTGAPAMPIAGGVAFVHSGSPRFTNCLFADNTAAEAGGLAVNSGAPSLFNCTIADNTASIGYGGAIYDPQGAVSLKNCISWGNSSGRGSKEVENYSKNASNAVNSNIEGGYPGTGNINADPLFEVAVGDYRLQSSSPCRDGGTDASPPQDVADLDWDLDTSEDVPFDLDMLPRIASTNVDIGAYEYRECATDADCTGGDVCCSGLCEPCCDDADCDDSLFCTGVETCSSNSCQSGSFPCAAGQFCSENFDVCGCVTNAECADLVFCNGVEVCVSGSCEAGTDPCPGQFCDEVAKVCVWCNQDSDCQTGEMCCSGNCQECCNNSDCPGFLNNCCPSQGYVCSPTCPQ